MNDYLSKIKPPAIGLIVAGSLNFVTALIILLSGLVRLAGGSGGETLPVRGAERFGYLVATAFIYGSSFFALIVSPLVVYGAIQMMQAKSYKLAKTSAILAVIPFVSCCFVIGVPLGIWALIVLSKSEAKTLFDQK